MQGFIKEREKSSWCPKHLPRPLQAGGKRSSEIFFPSHRNFHRGKNVPFPIQGLLELPQTAPREGWGRSGTLQRGEAGGDPTLPGAGTLPRDCWVTQGCLSLDFRSLSIPGMPWIPAHSRSLSPEPRVPRPHARSDTSSHVPSPVSFLFIPLPEHCSLKIEAIS